MDCQLMTIKSNLFEIMQFGFVLFFLLFSYSSVVFFSKVTNQLGFLMHITLYSHWVSHTMQSDYSARNIQSVQLYSYSEHTVSAVILILRTYSQCSHTHTHSQTIQSVQSECRYSHSPTQVAVVCCQRGIIKTPVQQIIVCAVFVPGNKRNKNNFSQ